MCVCLGTSEGHCTCVPVGNKWRSLYMCPCREHVEVTVHVSL